MIGFGISLLEIISGRKAIDVSYSPPSAVDWDIPLIKGKFAVYDPRIPPPKDPVVRKQLTLIEAKCVSWTSDLTEKQPRRVYSDLGFSSNLMDLMATTEEAEFIRDADGVVQTSSKSVEQVSSSKFKAGCVKATFFVHSISANNLD
ncbi:serine/threonine-protein kinase [Trifolium pratense]|uniref:Serine/threonine-protein kinase n=1 Tax=Trifolium pratense TaxID=57577 RepID=A0A2K3NX26_TRIPR|nr:serine/threonine-protein kinase [Trifolium pratense]